MSSGSGDVGREPLSPYIVVAAARTGRRVRRRVFLIALLMLLLAGTGIAVWMDTTWRSVRTELQERMLTALAEAAAPMTLLFTEVERVLGEVVEKASPTATEGTWLTMPDGRSVMIDGDGRPLGETGNLVLPGPAELLALVAAGRATGLTQLSLPFRFGSDWYATAVRPDPHDPGTSAALTFSIDAMLRAWAANALPQEASFALLTAEGRVWLRHPFAAELIGADASGGPLFRAMQEAAAQQGIAAIAAGGDEDGERLVGWRRVPHFGLTIAAGQSMASVTLLWRERYDWLFLGAGLVTLLAVGGVLLVGRTLAREASGREAASLVAAASEQRFRDIADAASDWFWETDESGRFTYVSDRVRDACGLEAGWFRGRSFGELLEREQDPEHAALFLADLEDRRPFRDFIFRMDVGRGRARWLKTSGKPLFDGEERFLGYRGTASDITLPREAEGRAAAAQLRLLRAIESVSEAIALFNREDRLVMCNQRFRSLHMPGEEARIQPGMSYTEFLELLGRTGRVDLAGQSLEAWIDGRMRLRALGDAAEQRMADGTWYRVSVNRTPEGDSITVFSDVTAFKAREAQLIVLAGGRSGAA